MTDNQIMAIFYEKQERDEKRAALKKTLKRKIEEARPKNSGSSGKGCGGCTPGLNGCTDDEIPQQLSFFD